MTEEEKIEYCKDCKYFDGLYCIVGGGCFESDEDEENNEDKNTNQ